MEDVKVPPAINFPEVGAPAERLDMAFRKVLTVPKEALLRDEAKEKHPGEEARGQEVALIHPLGCPNLPY